MVKFSSKKNWQWTKSPRAMQWFAVFRWLHVYLSTALFALLLFFCFTGFTLNHADWFGGESSSLQTFTLPENLTQSLRNAEQFPTRLLLDHIADAYGLSNPKSIEQALDIGEIGLDYPLPAGFAYITVLIEEGILEIDHQQGGWIALLNDLHKGRYSGEAWSLLIDVSAVIMILFSIAGLVILLQNRKYRNLGLMYSAAGLITPVIIYLFFVPRF